MTDKERLDELASKLILYRRREVRFKSPRELGKGEDWYSYLVNAWIVNQPDAEALMELYIAAKFNEMLFVGLVIHGPRFWEKPAYKDLQALSAMA